MEFNKINNFIKGWFIGNFEPSLFKTTDFEIAVKRYKTGDTEPSHVHKIATEYTVVISGAIKMNGTFYMQDDIITVEPGEYSRLEVLEDSVLVCIKTPCVKDDKYES